MQYTQTFTKDELLNEDYPGESPFDVIVQCLEKIEAVADVMTTTTQELDDSTFFDLKQSTINAMGVILKDAAEDIVQLNLLSAEMFNKLDNEMRQIKKRCPHASKN